jgi:hypothetical protein
MSFVVNNFACFVIYDQSLQQNEECPSVRRGPGNYLAKLEIQTSESL